VKGMICCLGCAVLVRVVEADRLSCSAVHLRLSGENNHGRTVIAFHRTKVFSMEDSPIGTFE
jgi:hypothetical protein